MCLVSSLLLTEQREVVVSERLEYEELVFTVSVVDFVVLQDYREKQRSGDRGWGSGWW